MFVVTDLASADLAAVFCALGKGDHVLPLPKSWNLGRLKRPPFFLTSPVDANAAGEGLSSPKSCDTGVPIWGTALGSVTPRRRSGLTARAEAVTRVDCERDGPPAFPFLGEFLSLSRRVLIDCRDDDGEGANVGTLSRFTDAVWVATLLLTVRRGDSSKSSPSEEGKAAGGLTGPWPWAEASLRVARSPPQRARKAANASAELCCKGSEILRWLMIVFASSSSMFSNGSMSDRSSAFRAELVMRGRYPEMGERLRRAPPLRSVVGDAVTMRVRGAVVKCSKLLGGEAKSV